jgi:hypothetical protein
VRQEAERSWPSSEQPTAGLVMFRVTYYHELASVDVDNIVKPIQDALKRLVYVDDDQVTDIFVRQRNLGGNLRFENLTTALSDGLSRGREFLHIVIEDAPDQEVID